MVVHILKVELLKGEQMNNKLFRILILFISVCVASVTTLLAVSFGLSNSGLSNKNNELDEENKDLNNEVGELTGALGDLQNTINMNPNSVIASYEVDGQICARHQPQ